MAEPTGVLSHVVSILANSVTLFRTLKKKSNGLETVVTVSPNEERQLETQTKIQTLALFLNPIVANAVEVWRTTIVASLAMPPAMLALSLIYWAAVTISGTPIAGVMLLKTSWWLWIAGGLIQILALNYETAEDGQNNLAKLEEIAARLANTTNREEDIKTAREKQEGHQRASRRALVTRATGFVLVVTGILLFGVFISVNT